MYKQQLDIQLAKKELFNFFLLYGDEYLNEFYTNKLSAYYASCEPLKLYFDEYDFKTAYDYFSLGSLFSLDKFLIIRLGKKPLAKDIKDISKLISLCERDKHNKLLVVVYNENQKAADLEKAFKNSFARFFKPNFNEACKLLEEKAKDLNISLANAGVLPALLELFDGDLALAASELNKFEGLKIDIDFIKAHCIADAKISFDDFFDALFRTNELSSYIYKLDLDEFSLLGLLNSSFYRLFKLSANAKLYARIDFKAILGYIPPSPIANKLINQAKLIKINQYKDIFCALLECEYQLKCENAAYKDQLLLACLLKINKIIRA